MQMMSVVLPDLGAGFVLSLEIFVVTLVGARRLALSSRSRA